MRAVYTGVAHTRDKYNAELIDDYTQGIDYCAKLYISGDSTNWYLIYGLDMNTSYNESVVHNLGINELKRTYKVSFDDVKVELFEPLTIGGYKITSYDDMITLQESGAI